jgi:hypothetical protein
MGPPPMGNCNMLRGAGSRGGPEAPTAVSAHPLGSDPYMTSTPMHGVAITGPAGLLQPVYHLTPAPPPLAGGRWQGGCLDSSTNFGPSPPRLP